MPRIRVETGARLHFGFQNLSPARERIYGGVGVALDEPCAVVEAEPADEVRCAGASPVDTYAERAVELLDVPGASVSVESTLPRHVGLGSGTQLALATLAAVARANGVEANVRERAPALGRGGRSGVGVAGFESGGFVVDAGHPAERFTTAPPDVGTWQVPGAVARHDLPEHWRFVVVVPDAQKGTSGAAEDESMRAVVEHADPTIGDELAGVLVRRLLPAATEGDLDSFGSAVSTFGRLNGAWYVDEQGGVYRPPAGRLIERLSGARAFAGVGQSSWGPAVYGVTAADRVRDAVAVAEDALDAADVSGEVFVTAPRNRGARVHRVGETGRKR
ncbi:MAG: beta-ribofuranosylaminobenzene 5'-phosphate synthase family protein [Haloarculaceae archaeon]